MLRWKKTMRLLFVVAGLVVMASVAQAAPRQINAGNIHVAPVDLMVPAKIAFNISPNASYFWSAVLSKDGNLSWDGLPGNITIRVGIGGPVYIIYPWMAVPYAINTGDFKFATGSTVLVKVEINSDKGYRIADKIYDFPASSSVFNITLLGPPKPLVYKPVFNP